jgi:HAD superfamily hydrolase (TIGR01509 family)
MASSADKFISRLKGVIFDVDGTIIDSMKVHMKAWQKIFSDYGYQMSIREVGEVAYGINPEIVRRVMGNLTDEIVEKISNEKEEWFRSAFDPEEDVIKGLVPFLEMLQTKGIPMVVGSAAPPENIDYFMERLNIRFFFKGFIHEDDVSRGKPSPEVFLKAARTIGMDIRDCVVFEDSTSGAEASAEAGSSTVIVLSSKSEKDFADIPSIVRFIKNYEELLET